uniref:G_PROTEIN_RECEP_F1_2 domain-containing protein n=1 Tax=Panagrellus redivivus TaxID=6233 RepID=A0A7E4VQX1_PANRE
MAFRLGPSDKDQEPEQEGRRQVAPKSYLTDLLRESGTVVVGVVVVVMTVVEVVVAVVIVCRPIRARFAQDVLYAASLLVQYKLNTPCRWLQSAIVARTG